MTTTALDQTGRAAAPILALYLREGWRGLIAWSLGVAAVLGVYLPIFPSLQTPELQRLIEGLPPELATVLGFDQIATGAGYTQATFFGLLGFALAAVACISWGAASVAGAEESGSLELTLAHAVSRARYVRESAAALVGKTLALGVVAFLLILGINGPAGLDLAPANLLAATLAWAGLGALCGAIALAVGAAFGRRTWALGAGAGMAALGYVLHAVARTSENFTGASAFSPFQWAFGNDPLTEGFDWAGLGLLWGVTGALVIFASWILGRRDVTG